MTPPDPRTLPAYLREAGLELSVAELRDALLALTKWPGSLDADEAVRRLRVVLARDAESWRVLPALVQAWRNGETIEHVAGEGGAGRAPLGRDRSTGEGDEAPAGLAAEGARDGPGSDGEVGADAVEAGADAAAGAGARAARGARSGRHGEPARAERDASLAESLERYRRATVPRPRRRRAPDWRGAIELRRTWRQSLRTLGEPVRVARQRRPVPAPHRVLLVDTSASMEGSDGFAATLARALAAMPIAAEVRAFDVDLLPGRWPQTGRPEGGGTQIGVSLVRYLRGPGRRLRGESHVMIWSDGWETGDIHVLERALGALGARAGRVDWLCPIAGSAGFAPTCRGLQAALEAGIAVYDVHDGPTFARYVDRLVAAGRVGHGGDARGGGGRWAS